MNRVLVTGGTGFIGSHLVRQLLADGNEVAVMTRYAARSVTPRLADIWDRVRVLEADVRDLGSLDCIHSFQPDTIFHLAAYNHVGQSWQRYEECYDVNAKGTANMLKVKYDSTVFVYMSSSEVYGLQETSPWHETMMPLPQSPYGVTKYAGELACAAVQNLGRDDIRIVRAFNTYGPGQSEKAVIPAIIRKALAGKPFRNNSGKQKREFNFVSDIVDGLIRAADANYLGPLNLSCGQNISIRELIDRIFSIVGHACEVDWSSPHRPNEIWDMCGCGTRAYQDLNWQSHVELDDGLAETIKWCKEQWA